jgi:hypothetical protein
VRKTAEEYRIEEWSGAVETLAILPQGDDP